MIDREALVRRHNPTLHEADTTSPLTIGNGELAYTADVTGMQTLYREYCDRHMPLCTLSQWGWHTSPVSEERYAYHREDLIDTVYDSPKGEVRYPIEAQPGNEEVYHWLRQNPHRLNLIRIGLVDYYRHDFQEWQADELTDMTQTLHMEEGLLESNFRRRGRKYHVESLCAADRDLLQFHIQSSSFQEGTAILVAFPYGSPDISASDWEHPEKHHTAWDGERSCFTRILDHTRLEIMISCLERMDIVPLDEHRYLIRPQQGEELHLMVMFRKLADLCEDGTLPQDAGEKDGCSYFNGLTYQEVKKATVAAWKDFWHSVGVVDLHASKDARALELERRIVLSQYLMRINSSGSVPPQETGLTCNSWYGKFHLEMYFWHEAWLPLWGETELLMKSLDWCVEHLPQARENAARNGYRGARWPKMIAEDAEDSPSPIAPLLIWQQPHIIYMIYLAYRATGDLNLLKRYEALITESAEFMVDFAWQNPNGEYELPTPVIPVQECHDPRKTANPTFEVEYWKVTLTQATEMLKAIGKEAPTQWMQVAGHMIPSPQADGKYLACSGRTDTFTDYAKDHPSMLMAYGVIDSGRMDPQIMDNTLMQVCSFWDEQSLWGWDFAVMAMCAVRLGQPERAIDLILKDTMKNVYVTSGNNRQESRDDLPLYLPGNGSLLLAIAAMCAGFDGCSTPLPGFPKDGSWTVEYEGILPLP